jgi:hypothetical protein
MKPTPSHVGEQGNHSNQGDYQRSNGLNCGDQAVVMIRIELHVPSAEMLNLTQKRSPRSTPFEPFRHLEPHVRGDI